jgi:hypothetical protein
MLDVHVIVSENTPPEWVRQCASSIRLAVSCTPFPVAIHHISGTLGHIGKPRAEGYAQGEYPYVTFVDDDDYVLPHIFRQMENTLREGIRIAATPEIILRNDYFAKGRDFHHGIAYRRDQVINHAAWKCCGDIAQYLSVPQELFRVMPEPAYVHRVYESRARLMRREHQEEFQRALAYG